MLMSLFKPRPVRSAGRRLFSAAVAQARTPSLYADLGVPDTTEGRFELYSCHVYLVLERLKNQGPQAVETGQALFDAYTLSLDDALREMGVGDLSVGRKMRKLGEAFYGRVQSFEAALAALPLRELLEALLSRTVYAEGGAEAAPRLAEYLIVQRAELAGQATERLLQGEVSWRAA